jgi:hypothetical protein
MEQETLNEGSPEQKSFTNWIAFEQAGRKPKEIQCNGYKPIFMTDYSCHSRVRLSAAHMLSHLLAEHGGGFYVQTAPADGGKAWGGWRSLGEQGLEAVDIRCGVCNEPFEKLTAGLIQRHCRAHLNQNRRMEQGGLFKITISATPVQEVEQSEESDGLED